MMVLPAGRDDAHATVNDAASRLAPGTRLGHYEVQAFIAAGGMGEVYRGKDTHLGRTVAIKVLPADAAFDEDRGRRFEQEARAVSALNHPHICVVHDFACELPVHDNGAPQGAAVQPVRFLVMEYLDGQTLAERLKKGPLPPAQALEYGAQIADALNAAHRHGILHRDVKPGNVMLTRNGAKLMDFGLARLTEPTDATITTTTHTAPGTVLGTVPYMAPEQLEGRPVDARTDIFSFGALLYEMLTGRRAFPGTSPVSVMTAILEHDPPPVTTLQASAPPLVDRLVATCLAKDPDKRLDSAHDVAEQLRWIVDAVKPGKADSATTTGFVRRWWPVAVGLLLLLIIFGPTVARWLSGGRLPGLASAPRQLTTSATWDAEPAVSPDGTMVAYTSGESGNADIWVLDIREGTPLCLTPSNADWDSSAAWFPDSTQIAYVSQREDGRGIWKVGRLGGPSTLLVPNAEDPAVSPDGKQIAFVRATSSGDRRIAVAPIGDVAAARIITGDGDGLWDHREPAWSPDSATICYHAQRDLWCVASAGGRARRLTVDSESDFEPEWSSDGHAVFFSSLREGTHALWRIAANGGRPLRLTPGTGPESHPRVSRDGKRLVYATFLDNYDLVLRDNASGRTVRYGGVRAEFHPALSPDGRTLYFVSDRRGKFDLWSLSLSGIQPQGPPNRLTDYAGSVSMPSCSPDGKWLAFGHTERNRREILVIPASGGPEVRLTDGTSMALEPAWSPDGKWIAFLSDKSGTNRIWIVPVANGGRAGPARVFSGGPGKQELPAWSPDSTRMAFVSDANGQRDVWVATVTGAFAPIRATTNADAASLRWLDADRLLVSGLWARASYSIRAVSLKDASVTPLADAAGRSQVAGLFDVSRDGRIMVYTWEELRGNIWELAAASRIF